MNRILLFAAGLTLGLVIVPTWTRLSRAVAAEVLSCDRDVGSRVADVLRLEAMEADRRGFRSRDRDGGRGC